MTTGPELAGLPGTFELINGELVRTGGTVDPSSEHTAAAVTGTETEAVTDSATITETTADPDPETDPASDAKPRRSSW